MSPYATHIDGLVHEPTQTEGSGVDLTVAEVYEMTGAGRVDFGGGELEAAATEPHEREMRDPDDEYGWWSLDPGTYLVEYNESISGSDLRFTVQTRDALLERGAFHPTLRVAELPRVPLSVGGAGIRIKENARISTVVDIDPA
ncbi:dCTP deaminase [Halorubrum sp. SD626R]|uniref:dCTP deaminase n=1 Tax=Halorubrum sp. SD626R TaxID=1419722 RepID=UPI000B1E1228|nr:dCTP deaminase [Halorubrum sp. SD626R]TKX81455.1 dCTP deaminase [Halorubrum sp. SD626R]